MDSASQHDVTSFPARSKTLFSYSIVPQVLDETFTFLTSTQMDRLFNKKRKKTPQPSHQPIASDVDTSTAPGPNGLQTEQIAHSEGRKSSYCRDPETARTDLAVAAGGGNRVDPWIARQDGVEELWTSVPEIGSTGHEVKPAGKCS